MAITIPFVFVGGSPNIIIAARVNANFDAVADFVDELQAGTNFTAGAITETSIADSAVTLNKIHPSARAAADSDQFILAGQIFG